VGGSTKEVLYIWIAVALRVLMAIRAVPHEDHILEGHALQEVLTTDGGRVREV
jgi:hypothetical protein